jgi:serine/threonine-protein kinase HipA
MTAKKRCLFCYNELKTDEIDFHPACSRKIFGSSLPPELPYTENEMLELGLEVVRSQTTVTGVQAKLSLEVETTPTKDRRFTIVGLWGAFILKPPAQEYPFMPEVEDTTMHLAELAGISSVPHSLIRLKSGNLAYITKRIDRTKKGKIHIEDMCQLTERLTEHKYRGSHEQIARAILKYSANPGLDVVNFFEQVLFSFVTGNADMHLKSFSLINQPGQGYVLSPAYDMVATALLVKGDKEELALTLNGKKSQIKKKDFETAMASFGVSSKVAESTFQKFHDVLPEWKSQLQKCFLPTSLKDKYLEVIEERISKLS